MKNACEAFFVIIYCISISKGHQPENSVAKKNLFCEKKENSLQSVEIQYRIVYLRRETPVTSI